MCVLPLWVLARSDLSFVMSSPLRRCVQTAITALRRLSAPVMQPVRFLLHPQLQEIYLGPADTGRPPAEIVAEFLSEDVITDEAVQSGHISYPSWLKLDTSLLERDHEWYREKERVPESLSLARPFGRRQFARRQADVILEFLHSVYSWGQAEDRHIHPVGQTSSDKEMYAFRERSVLLVGHAGALEALLPDLPVRKRPGRKHTLDNGQVRGVASFDLLLLACEFAGYLVSLYVPMCGGPIRWVHWLFMRAGGTVLTRSGRLAVSFWTNHVTKAVDDKIMRSRRKAVFII